MTAQLQRAMKTCLIPLMINKNSNLYWIDGFNGGTPSDTLPQDIFGSKISVPVDLSAIDGGNANMKMYGDDIGRSSDIMSVDK